mmetsp:Transcript_59107/g.185492  ORF Transcript_59107/g.185492 Transcript_59107/m.185492 type:complete len:331 (-) Transcript_59107:533-1525(-)
MVHHMQRRPQGTLAEDVLRDARVVAVGDAGKLLHGAHSVAVGDGSHHKHSVPHRGENDHHHHDIPVDSGASGLMIRFNEDVDVLPQVDANVFEVRAVDAPPDFVPYAADTESSPVDNPAVEGPVLVTPEVRVVRIQVHVPQGDVIGVTVLPELDLLSVRIPGHQRGHEPRLELLRGCVLGEERSRNLRDELVRILELPPAAGSVFTSDAGGVHAPGLRGCPACAGVEVVRGEEVVAAQQAGLVRAGNPGAGSHQERVVLLGRTLQLPVLALVVGPLDLERAGSSDAHEGDSRGDQDEIGSLVADVAEVELRGLHRERGLKRAVGVDLLQV